MSRTDLQNSVAQTVKNLPAVQETWAPTLGREDPLEKGMATHSGILAWRILWTESLVGYSPRAHRESDMTERLTHTERGLVAAWSWGAWEGWGVTVNGYSTPFWVPKCTVELPEQFWVY